MNKQSYGYIYKVTNLSDNKVYIGQKKGKFQNNYLGSGTYIRRAINKYGKNNFKLEVIVFTKNKKDQNLLEEKYVKYYKKNLKNDCYNILDGGGCYTAGLKWIFSISLNKISLIHAKEKIPEGWIEGCNRSGKNNPMFRKGYLIKGKKNGIFGKYGEDNPLFGRKATLKTRQKQSKTAIGKHCGENSHFFGKPQLLKTKLAIKEANSDTKYIYNSALNKTKRIKKNNLFKYLDNGWQLGRGENFAKKCSESKVGNRNPMFGRIHSEEAKTKNSKAHLGQVAWNKGLTKETDSRLRSVNSGKTAWNKGLTKKTDNQKKCIYDLISEVFK